MSTYKITRIFASGEREEINSGVTLEEAKEHCSNPETSSRTATSPEAIALTAEKGPWFDGFNEED